MIKYSIGLFTGFVLGVSSLAFADGFMLGWTVTVGQDVICRDPFMWRAIKEIECDRR